VKPVRKLLFLDLLDPRFGLAGPACAEKQEGLAFGPNLPDGRRLLIVVADNDLRAERPILFHGFAVDRDSLPGFGWWGLPGLPLTTAVNRGTRASLSSVF
jgi:hypothetical protein